MKFLNIVSVKNILFDEQILPLCVSGQPVLCYTSSYDGSNGLLSLTVYHPLSKHLIVAEMPITKRVDFPYILFTVVVCLICLVFITRKFVVLGKEQQKVLQKLDTYIEHQRERDVPDTVIREKLIRLGWKATEVDSEIKKAKK